MTMPYMGDNLRTLSVIQMILIRLCVCVCASVSFRAYTNG